MRAEQRRIHIGEVLKWGASRPPPVADEGRRASGSRRRARANEFAKCDAVTATGSKRRRRFGDFPARCFSDNFIFFMEKYSSGRRGVTRKQTDFVTLYFPSPLRHLAFTELERRDGKRLVYSFLSKFRQLNIWRSTQVVEEA